MSNTAWLSTQARSGGGSRGELRVGHAVQARLPGPLAHDDDPEDRPGHGDRAEHRGEDADDQDEREALDDR